MLIPKKKIADTKIEATVEIVILILIKAVLFLVSLPGRNFIRPKPRPRKEMLPSIWIAPSAAEAKPTSDSE